MKQYLLIGLLFYASISLWAQEGPPQYHLGDYQAIGGGGSLMKIRDLGVSPIYYDGFLGLGQMEFVTKKERFSYSIYGTYGYGILKATRLSTYQMSIHNINYGGDFLHHIRELGPNLQLKAGGSLFGVFNIRNNPSFRNNSFTAESINSLAASAKIEWVIERNGEKRRLLGLVPVKAINPGRRVQKLSYQLNVPFFTAIWSPAFPYLDDFTEGTIDYNRKNEFKLGGFRLSNRFDYHYYLRNGNALRLSYNWEIFKGPNDFGRIEYGQHQVLFAFLIRLNELQTYEK